MLRFVLRPTALLTVYLLIVKITGKIRICSAAFAYTVHSAFSGAFIRDRAGVHPTV